MAELDNLMSKCCWCTVLSRIIIYHSIDEVAKNVTAATEHVNNISSQSNQLKLQLSKTQELYTPETSIAIKQTAENLLNLIINSTKENVNQQVNPKSFLEFVSSFRTFFCFEI